MAIGSTYIFEIEIIAAEAPEVGETLTHSWLDGEDEVFGATFLINTVTTISEGHWKVNVTQSGAGDLPEAGDTLVEQVDDDVYELDGIFSLPSNIIIYQRIVLAAGNTIYYESI